MRSRVSVVVPAFNAADFIADTLRSIETQSLRPDEVIVVDDGSTDETAKIASLVGSWIRVIRQPNAGPAVARNTGILAGQSHFVAIVDSDDLLLEKHLELTVAALEAHPEAPVAFGDIVEFSDSGLFSQSFWKKSAALHRHVLVAEANDGVQLLGAGLTSALFHGNIVPVSTTVIRRSAFAQAGLYSPAYQAAEDLDMNLRLSQIGSFAFVGQVTGHKRVHDQSLTLQSNALYWSEATLRVLAAFKTMHPRVLASSPEELKLQAAVRETASNAFHAASLAGPAMLWQARSRLRDIGWSVEPSLRDWARTALPLIKYRAPIII